MSEAGGQQWSMLMWQLLQCQGLLSAVFVLKCCIAAVLYVWMCVFLLTVFFFMLFFRALLRELHGVGASYLFLLQRNGHGVSSSGEGAFLLSVFLPLSSSCILLSLHFTKLWSFYSRWWCPVWPVCVRLTWVVLSVSSRNNGPHFWRHGSTAPSLEIHTFTSTSYTPQATSSTCRDEMSSWVSSPRHQTGTETPRNVHTNKHKH